MNTKTQLKFKKSSCNNNIIIAVVVFIIIIIIIIIKLLFSSCFKAIIDFVVVNAFVFFAIFVFVMLA